MINGGMEIGSHGMTHQFLTLMPYQAACNEICGSKAELEIELKHPVSSFAAVGGHYEKWMVQAAQRAGYSSFATMIPGKSIARDEFVVLNRNHIKIHHSLDYFKKTIGADTGIMFKNKMRYHFLNLIKRTVGYNRYDQIKHTIRKYRQLSHSA
jgi:peptidoglycan/xylan/chitin deacetylase (PgdA/CDA1 family)